MKALISAAMLAASVAAASACSNEQRICHASQIERLTAEDRATCEYRRDHARPAYKEIILERCVANFLAKYERGNS
ncbi:MAG: hypothetical protein MN733_01090 [Nitrososphaera sp.]|nr:hypothetical protein [Nitrososphaera sp.]